MAITNKRRRDPLADEGRPDVPRMGRSAASGGPRSGAGRAKRRAARHSPNLNSGVRGKLPRIDSGARVER